MKTITATIEYKACNLKRVATFNASVKHTSDANIIALYGRRNQQAKGDAFWQFDLNKVVLLQGETQRALFCEEGYIFLMSKFNRFNVD